jgi:hypothetical protein
MPQKIVLYKQPFYANMSNMNNFLTAAALIGAVFAGISVTYYYGYFLPNLHGEEKSQTANEKVLSEAPTPIYNDSVIKTETDKSMVCMREMNDEQWADYVSRICKQDGQNEEYNKLLRSRCEAAEQLKRTLECQE